MAEQAQSFELGDAAELGALSDRAVRVWVRQPATTQVSVRLEVEGHSPVVASVSPAAETDWTAATELELPEPAPDRAFVCTVGERRLTGRLAATSGTHTGLVFGFGSCHQPFQEAPDGSLREHVGAGIYPVALEHLREVDARFLLLLGDQLYSDALPSWNVRRKPLEAASLSHEELLERYRRVARLYFAQPGYRALREAFPTYCMWDDHEIFDNWGSHLTRSELDLRLFEAASRVFCEYQGLRNPGGRLGPPPYHFSFRHGDIGFLVLDMRGARNHERGLLLGAEQWEWFRAALRDELEREVQTLFIGVTVPVVHTARWLAKAFSRMPGMYGDSLRDRWSLGRFIEYRDAFLAELFSWQSRSPERQVFLLSGDIHAANAYSIHERSGTGVIHQFTSSAFSVLPDLEARALNLVASRAPNRFEPKWRFRRHFQCHENNLGTVRLEPLSVGGHRVTFQVMAWEPASRRLALRGQLASEPSAAQAQR
ncbi:MAG TPA: alkaline phosphatase D family protein [Myxococcaceae bacterium]|jgi:phosphodiesterase/alkaline phosphatase D-like protein